VPPRPSSGQTVQVVVNGEPITSYAIDQRIALMKISNEKGGRKQAIEELIDESLQLQEAKRVGLTTSDEEVDTAYGTIAQRVKMNTSQLTQALNAQGIQSTALKERLRAQITWQRLVQARLSSINTVAERDVTAALLSSGDTEKMTLKEYTLQQIIFVVPDGSSSAYISQRRREAEAFRQRFQGCDNSIQQAQSLKGVVVKPIGRRDSTQLSGPAAEKTTPPSQTDEGVELIAICSIRDIASSAGARAEIENKLKLEQADESGEEYLEQLRERAVITYT
jgi:peptidyl-prolyl cis-trans isomerase SurA